jgi:hypothetical protein
MRITGVGRIKRRAGKSMAVNLMKGMKRVRIQGEMPKGRMGGRTIVITGKISVRTNTDKGAAATAKTTVSTPANARASSAHNPTTPQRTPHTTTAPNNTTPKPQHTPTCTATMIYPTTSNTASTYPR